MADSKQCLRDEMQGEVPSHLRDRILVGNVDVSLKESELLFGQMYFQPSEQGPGSAIVTCTRQAFELYAAPMQKEFSKPMQLAGGFIRLYSNVAGLTNHLNYHQDGNKLYTRVPVGKHEVKKDGTFRKAWSLRASKGQFHSRHQI